MIHPQENATPEQRATLARLRSDEALTWLVIFRDGTTALPHMDKARANLYAAQQHAVLLPLCVPQWALDVAGHGGR